MSPTTKNDPKDPSVAKLVARGNEALKARRSNNAAPVSAATVVTQKDIIKRLAGNAGEVDESGRPMPETVTHRFFGDKNLTEDYTAKGCTPALEDGEWVHFKGDPCWQIPMDVYQAGLATK